MELKESAARGAALLAALGARLNRQRDITAAGGQAGVHQRGPSRRRTTSRRVAAAARDPVSQPIPRVSHPHVLLPRVRVTAVLPVPVAHTPPIQRPRAQRRGLPARYGTIALGSVLLTFASVASIPLGPAESTPLREWLVVIAAATGLSVFIAASLPIGPLAHWRRWYPRLRHAAMLVALLLAVGTLLMFAGSAMMMARKGGEPYYTDILSLTAENAHLVLTGHNPYTTNSGFRAALARYPGALATPIRGPIFGTGYDHPAPSHMMAVQQQYVRAPASERGAFDPHTLHSYPALSFLVYVPFMWLGVDDILIVHFVLYGLICAWLLWRAPVGWRHWGALALLAATPALAASVLLGTEVICIALVLAAWRLRERRWLFAVLLGLACAYKQYAWFFAPLLMLDVVLAYSWREALKRGAIVLGAFLVPNLPYLIASPGPWFRSLWLPMSDPLFATGTGIIALAIGHIVPYGSPAIYAGLELAALVAILWIYARWRPRLGESAPLLALVPLFFAFRSSPNYFAFAPILAIYAAQALYPRRAPWSPAPVAASAVDASVLRQLAPVPKAIGTLGEALRAQVCLYLEAARGVCRTPPEWESGTLPPATESPRLHPREPT